MKGVKMLILFTDTDTDMTPSLAKEYGYHLISMPYIIDDKVIYPYEDFEEFNYKEFYEMAKERIDKAKYQDKLNNESYNSTASYNEYYITCLPWTDFISMTHPIPEDKSSQTVPRVCWGKYIENNGKYEISLNITVSHVFVDGYHLSKVFNNVQELLNDTTNVLK